MKATAEQITRLNSAGRDRRGNEKKSKAVTLSIAREDWPQPTPPREGRMYKVQNEYRDSLFAVTALHVSKTDEGWDVIVRKGDHRDVPKLLRARPNHEIEDGDRASEDSDYTSQPRLAMSDEPEAVADIVQQRYARGAAVETAKSRDRLLREARDHIARGTEILEELGSTGKRTASSITHHLEKIAPVNDQEAA